ncbi:hypothetical protein BOX15_Mlig007908g3 [Macrostomum lignano]|uniref:FERM domain-containing protein n=1 Tax=Macrostomum lignano TaxID=282301 RepID=A0A267DXE2_9PLAT|nr:hypothetical protein BOX15_Mlig007908g3 [Macrostomum lignano]
MTSQSGGSAASPRRPVGSGGSGGGGNKVQTVKVVLLDDTVNSFQVPCRVPGQELFNAVVKKLRLLEIDYFDLEFLSKEGRQCWLDHSKTLPKQCPSSIELVFYFSVKFYPPDPHLLEDEFTRFLFSLQIKRDLINGLLPCSENTTALLASYLVQAEIGDYLEDEYLDALYLTQVKVLPEPVSDELLRKVMEYHRAHFGLSPEDAEYSLLDTVRKVELYGVRLHAARDHDGLPLNLAVAHPGVLVFQGAVRVNTFSWAKIRKLSFKRKKFLVKLHPDTYGYYKDTVDFYFDSRDECKQFWKKCIEHHTFFRCQSARAPAKHKNIVVSKGSSFRYCGRTQKQLVEFVRENYVKRPYFDRTNRSLPSRSPGSRRSGPSSSHHQPAGGGRSGASTTSHGSHVLLPSSNGDATRPLLDMAAGHLRRPASVSPPPHPSLMPSTSHIRRQQQTRPGAAFNPLLAVAVAEAAALAPARCLATRDLATTATGPMAAPVAALSP